MRSAFVEVLVELAACDERIMLLTADLGWSVLERFADRFPGRFINVGVAEQNMLGIATGLARAGHVPYVYSIATFSTMRCYEQLRNGPVLHHLPVRVVGVGGGFAYGHAGPSHYAVEDLAINRTQPGLTVVAPADRTQASSAIRATANLPGPVYLRLDKNVAPDIPGLDGRFALGTPEVVKDGQDLLIISTGSVTQEAVKAAEWLSRRGISAAVAVMAHLALSAPSRLHELLSNYAAVMSVEEGFATGGLGSLVAETLVQNSLRARLSIHGVKVPLASTSGETAYMRRQYGLDAGTLADAAQTMLSVRRMAA
jgi:transketolase